MLILYIIALLFFLWVLIGSLMLLIKIILVLFDFYQEHLLTFKKRMQDFDFALLNINERFGEWWTKNEVSKIKVVGNYVFFQIDEGALYDWYEEDKSEDTIVAIYLDSFSGEIVCDFDVKSFKWSKKALQNISDDLDTI
jgi:hypothetical protein